MTKAVFTADDFGLSKGITDTILETVDKGPVRQVSLLVNGEAVDYAIAEYKKRDGLTLALHLNLTEGPALSPPDEIPLLVDASGRFMYGVVGLWLLYLRIGRAKRKQLRVQLRREIEAQATRLQAADIKELVVNGHQHAHLLPFVFDELIALPGIARIRLIREPFQWTWKPFSVVAWCVLSILSRRALHKTRARGVATNDSFVGFLHSGRMTREALQEALSSANGLVEVLLHPGSALPGELSSWKDGHTDIEWHYSPWRKCEREILLQYKELK